MAIKKIKLHYKANGDWDILHPETQVAQIIDIDTIIPVTLTDYIEDYRGEGSATFIGKNYRNALTSDTTWKLRIIYHEPQFHVYDYDGVAWDDRYDYPQ